MTRITSCDKATLDTIGELGDRKLARLAEPALNDDVPEVLFAATRALHRLRDPAGKAMLLAIVEKEEKARSNPLRVRVRTLIRRRIHRDTLAHTQMVSLCLRRL